MAAEAREPFRVVSCEPGVAWAITGVAASAAPRRIWVELERTPSPSMAASELLDALGIPFDEKPAGEGDSQ